ncbi:MAG: DNA/RNA nuclease SfsA [Veillonellales bacterium]
MKYEQVISGKFIKRDNRFIARVWVDGREEVVHVKNTGRCKELLLPGVTVILAKAVNPNRRTAYSLIAVYKGKKLINMDSQVPNQVVAEALQQGKIAEVGQVDRIRREVTYGNSRFDIYFESVGQKGFIEVKGVTLEQDGTVLFPDAPTVRGTKHIYEMVHAVGQGYAGCIFFLVQMNQVSHFTPNRKMDADFAEALSIAAEKGVRILVYDSVVREDEIFLGNPVSFVL